MLSSSPSGDHLKSMPASTDGAVHRATRLPEGSSSTRSASRFKGTLEFLAGRYCKWDMLYSQLLPYPTDRPKSDTHTPAQIQSAYEKRAGK